MPINDDQTLKVGKNSKGCYQFNQELFDQTAKISKILNLKVSYCC